jgi:hypothetical protein
MSLNPFFLPHLPALPIAATFSPPCHPPRYGRACRNLSLWTERPLSKSSNWFGQVGWMKEEPRAVLLATSVGRMSGNKS